MVIGHGGDQLQIRVFGLDGLVVLGVAVTVGSGFVEPIFVADLDVAQLEGRRVTVLHPLCTPLRVGVAGYVLDLIQSILDVGLQIGSRLYELLLHGVAGINGQQRLHLEVLAPLQELEQAHAVAGAIVPGTGVGRAIHQGADGLLPFIALVDVVALEIIASGEAEKRRLHRRQLLHQVDAISVVPVVVGGRKQTIPG